MVVEGTSREKRGSETPWEPSQEIRPAKTVIKRIAATRSLSFLPHGFTSFLGLRGGFSPLLIVEVSCCRGSFRLKNHILLPSLFPALFCHSPFKYYSYTAHGAIGRRAGQTSGLTKFSGFSPLRVLMIVSTACSVIFSRTSTVAEAI